MRWFAEQGWVVVSVDYTLSSVQQYLWQTTEKQIACAMVWTAQHIAAYGGDITHLALTGDSAGGNIALNCAYQANAGTLTSGCGGVIPRVKAVALLYPVVSPASFYTNPDPVLGIAARRMAGSYLGSTPRELSAGYQAVASATYIRPTAPPTLLLAGSQDHLVPQQPTIDFAELARRAGIPTRLVVYPCGNHAFDGFFNSLGDQTYRQLFQRWFVENGLVRATPAQGAKAD